MAATGVIPTRSVQISSALCKSLAPVLIDFLLAIATTLLGANKTKDLFIKVDLGGFNPARSLDGAATIRVQLCKSNFIRHATVLAVMEFTLQKAQEILGDLTEVTDHLFFSNAAAEFRLSFSMKSNATHDLIREGVNVAYNLKSVLDHLGSGFKFFETVLSLGVAASEVNPIAKAVLASVSQVNKLLKAQDKCEKEICDLIVGMADCLHCIADVRQFAKSDQLLYSLEALDPLVRDTVNFISQYGSLSLTTRVFSLNFSDKTTDELESLKRRFSSFKQRFDRGVAAQTGLTVEELKEQLNLILDDSAFREEAALLRALKPGISDIRRGQDECMEDTRVDILRVIDEWIDDDNGPNLFWLHGHPGTGKSAIAATVRSRLLKAHQLGSSFFFRREDFVSQTPEALWCTIAYDLTQKFSAIRRLVVGKLKSQEVVPNITSHDDIFNHLIAIPLTLSPDDLPGRPLVIVIDALDECGGLQESQSYQRPVLRALGRCQTLPLRVKIFITSRNDGNIESVLGTGGPRCKVLEVWQDVTRDSSSDIQKYLKRGFGEILAEFKTIPTPWPTESDLQILTNTAAGLFIRASTVLNLIRDGDPIRDLDAILAMIRSHGMHMSPRMDLLGQLYAVLLASKFKTRDQITRFVKVAGTVIAARTPLSSEDLVELITPLNRAGFEQEKLDKTDLDTICKKLKSVLDTGSGLRFLHQSFVDFLISLPIESQFRSRIWDVEMHRQVGMLTGHTDLVTSVAFSTDNRWIVSGSRDCTIRIWNAKTHQQTGLPLTGHTTGVLSVMFSPDSQRIVSGAGDGDYTLRVWDAETGQQLGKDFTAHTRDVTSVAFSPNGTHVVSGSHDRTVRIWSPDEQQQIGKTLVGHTDGIRSVTFCPNGTHIASGSHDRTIRLWDASTCEQIGETIAAHTDHVASVAFSHDGKLIISGSSDHTIKIWDVETGEQIGEALDAHTNPIRSVAISPNGKHVASGGNDCTVRIWSTETHNQAANRPTGHTNRVTSVMFSRDNKHIISGSDDNTIRIWDVDTLQQAAQISASSVTSVALSHDGTRIASGSNESTVQIWDMQTCEHIEEIHADHPFSVTSASFSHDDTQIVVGSGNPIVRIFNIETQMEVGNLPSGHGRHPLQEILHHHTKCVTCVAFSHNGHIFVSGADDCTAIIWDAETYQQIGILSGHTDQVTSVAFSSNDRHLVSGSSDCTVRIWDLITYQQVGQSLTGHTISVLAVAFSPNNKHIASGGGDYKVRIWNLETNQHLKELTGHTHDVTSVAFSPNGTHVVSGSHDRTVRIWSPDEQQQIGKTLVGHTDGIRSVTFSPNGTQIASGSHDHTIRLWDVATCLQIGVAIVAHTDHVASVAFSRDGKHIVSSSSDCTIKMWDAETQEQIGESFEGHTESVRSVVFSPEGKKLLSGGNDCTVRIWCAQHHNMAAQNADAGHTARVTSVHFSPDKKYIVSASDDHTIRIWDADTHQQVGEPFTGHTDSVVSVDISKDGRRVVSGSSDSTLRVWNVESHQQIGEAMVGHDAGVTSVAFSPDDKYIVSGSYDFTVRIWDSYTCRQPRWQICGFGF
ncbi:quinon protein alcohol dehydrogenase-like superfamily [Mycena rebaudengoi]|nr:quinon protein alcohol dehydrogenase-like superfamily [Mycena rebaudengoi]